MPNNTPGIRASLGTYCRFPKENLTFEEIHKHWQNDILLIPIAYFDQQVKSTFTIGTNLILHVLKLTVFLMFVDFFRKSCHREGQSVSKDIRKLDVNNV